MTRRMPTMRGFRLFCTSAGGLLLALSLAVTAFAQDGQETSQADAQAAADAPQTLSLTLDQAVEMALERNWDLRLADLALLEAQAAVDEAYAPDRLQVNFEGTYSRLGPEVTMELPLGDDEPVSFTISPSQNLRYGLQLYKSLYSSGRNETLQTLAHLQVDVRELESAVARRQVALAATSTFYAVTRAMGFVQVAEEASAAAREHWRLAAVRYQAGAVPKFDMMRAEVDVANAEQEIITARTGVAVAQSALKNLLALEMTEPVELVAAPAPVPLEVDPARCISLAHQNRQEIAVARANQQRAALAGRLARAQHGVNVNLIGGYDRQGASGIVGDGSWSVTLQASKPISDGGASRSKEQQAMIQAEQAATAVEKLHDSIAREVWEAYLRLEEAKSHMQTTTSTVELAEEALRISEVRYEAGLATPVEVSDARVALTGARTNHVNAVYGYQLAQAQLLSTINASEEELGLLVPRSEDQ